MNVKIHNQPGFQKDQDDAQKQLNEHVDKQVVCTVIHKPTNKATAGHVKMRDVREYARQAVDRFIETYPVVSDEKPRVGDFVIVEVGIDDPTRVVVSTLE